MAAATSISRYFRQLQQYDLAAKGLVEVESLPRGQVERTRRLEEQLVQLQQKVVSDFCQNYFYGEGVLANFLVLMNETRDFLRRSRLESLANDSPTLDEGGAGSHG